MKMRRSLWVLCLMTTLTRRRKSRSRRSMQRRAWSGLLYSFQQVRRSRFAALTRSVEQDTFPSYRCTEEHEIAEERRLLYVAMTRAQVFLVRVQAPGWS